MITEKVLAHLRENQASEDYKSIKGDFQMINGHLEFAPLAESITPHHLRVVAENLEIIDRLIMIRSQHKKMLVGDFLDNGKEMSRVTYIWENQGQVQAGGTTMGQFSMYPSGDADYSGSLTPSQPISQYFDSGVLKEAMFWFFSQNRSGGNRGIRFWCPVKVWKKI